MWKSFPCHSACATAWVKFSPDIVSWANSGFSPTISGHSSSSMNASAWPTVGQEDVAARLVRLRLERDDAGRSRARGCTRSRGRRPPCSGRARPHVLGGVGLDALAAAPHHVHLRRRARRRGRWRRSVLAHREPTHRGSLAVNAPSLNTGWRRGWSSPSAPSCRSRRAPGGTASGSPRARRPTRRGARGRRRGSSRRRRRARPGVCTDSTGSSGGRTSWPNGSRPGLPTVQRPNVKWCSACGVYGLGHGHSSRFVTATPILRERPLRPDVSDRRTSARASP